MRRALTKVAAAVALLVLAAPAQADPVTLAALSQVGSAIVGFAKAYGAYALMAMNIYGAVDARRRAKAAQRKAIATRNAALTDRSLTLLRGNPPWRIVYGECITGGDVLAMFTSDKTTVSSSGSATTKPDALKHLVINFASHQVEDIGDIFIEGVPLGGLDGDGYATGSDWTTGADSRLVTINMTGSTTLSVPATEIVSAVTLGATDVDNNVDRTVAISGGGTTLTVTDGLGDTLVHVVYRTSINPSVVRISKFYGAEDQTVNAYLNGIKPAEWDSSHRLRGIAGIVVTLDLEDPRFQGGPPNITARVKGKRLYDPRLDSTNGGSGSHRRDDPSTWEWSANNALCTRDWITGEYGMAAAQDDVLDEHTIAAANACDQTYTVDVGGTPVVTWIYRCHGVATTEEGREKVLDDLADSMAGFAIYGAQWQIMAGAWTVPVMDLTDDDLDGAIEVLQAGAGIDELVNGIRGSYVPWNSASATDFEPYTNATFAAADGDEYWQDIALPFTNSKAVAANIARVMVERGRNSMIVAYPAKLRAWPLQVGDRVTITSAEFQWTEKPFRVTDWQFGLRSPVGLVLQEDTAEAYDNVDAVSADPTPNTGLPSPWEVEAIALNIPESGTSHLIRARDGTITTRVWVSWAALTGAYLQDGQGTVVVRWQRLGRDVEWQEVRADAADAGVYLLGLQDGDRIVIEACALNSMGHRGAAATTVHTVIGKTAAPAAVVGMAGNISKGRIDWAWDDLLEVDYARTEVRATNTGWGNPATPPLWAGAASSWSEPVSSVGGITRYARHFDSSGNYSATAASASVTVADEDLIESIAALAEAAHSGQTQYVAARAWNFPSSAEGWSAGGSGTISTALAHLVHGSVGTDPNITSPAGLLIYGPGFSRVRARIKRTAGSGWDGTLYYATVAALPGYAGHSFDSAYRKEVADSTITGEWVVLEWDMSALTAGGNDWTTRTIDQLRLDLGATSADAFDIDWIAVGTLAPGSYGAQFGLNISGQASTSDLAAAAATAFVPGYTESTTASWARGGVDTLTAMRRVLRQDSWTNDTGEAVLVEYACDFGGVLTSGPGSVRLWAEVGTSAIADGNFSNSDSLPRMTNVSTVYGRYVTTRAVELADGDTLYVAAVAIINTANSTTTDMEAEDINIKILGIKR